MQLEKLEIDEANKNALLVTITNDLEKTFFNLTIPITDKRTVQKNAATEVTIQHLYTSYLNLVKLLHSTYNSFQDAFNIIHCYSHCLSAIRNCSYLLGIKYDPIFASDFFTIVASKYNSYKHEIYNSSKLELYILSSCIYVLQGMIDITNPMPKPETIEKLIFHFQIFVTNIRSKTIKLHCLLALIYYNVILGKVTAAEYLLKIAQIQPFLETKLSQHDYRLITFIHKYGDVHNNILLAKNSITLCKTKKADVLELRAMIGNNKYSTIKTLIELGTIDHCLAFIKQEPPSTHFSVLKLFQSDELLIYLMQILMKTFEISISVLSAFRIHANSPAGRQEDYADILYLQSELLDRSLQLNATHTIHAGCNLIDINSLLEKKASIISELAALAEQSLKSETIFREFFADNLPIKKSYTLFGKRHSGSTIEKKPISVICEKQAVSAHTNFQVQPICQEKLQLVLPKSVIELNKFLTRGSYRTFITGGFIRDYFLSKVPLDVDIVVINWKSRSKLQALYYLRDELAEFFPCDLRGAKYPILHLQMPDTTIDISVLTATNQNEHEIMATLYSEFLTKDTTENVLCYDIANQQVIDFFGGIADLKANRIRTIKTPDECISNDPIRIYRIIRSITNRQYLPSNPLLSSNCVNALKKHLESLATVNKDRIFNEVNKILFRGHSLAVWQFCEAHDLTALLTFLPNDASKRLLHLTMISSLLMNLDQRICNGIRFNSALVFSVLLFSQFNLLLTQKLSACPDITNEELNNIISLSTSNNACFYRLPEGLKEEISSIFCAYLKLANISSECNASSRTSSCANVLLRLQSKAILAQSTSLKFAMKQTMFYKQDQLKSALRNTIHKYCIELTYKDKTFILTLPQKGTLNVDHNSRLIQIKKMCQLILGKWNIYYETDNTSLTISTHMIDKKRAIDTLMNFLFDTLNPTLPVCNEYLPQISERQWDANRGLRKGLGVVFKK